MYFPEDEKIARKLQNELNSGPYLSKSIISKDIENPIHSDLELEDPTPSIHNLFVTFDKKFFWGSLGMVQVLWSNKMTRCAGLCSFEGKHGLCKISLSAPLLSLRPRKDLVETLLHEMIHAYLFITNNFKDREDHGPEFHKHMYRINKEAGTNVTVYHTYHDEVAHYQRHIWRCDGSCRFKRPHFGFIRRAMNRAPGPNDFWWNQHKVDCGGTFLKISEPEKKKKVPKPKKSKSTEKSSNIQKWFDDDRVSTPKFSEKDLDEEINEPKFKAPKENQINKKYYSKKFSSSQTNLEEKKNLKSILFANRAINNAELPSNVTALSTNLSDDVGKKENKDNSNCVRQVVRDIWSNKFLPKEELVEPPKKKRKIKSPTTKKEFLSNPINKYFKTSTKTLDMVRSEITNVSKEIKSSIEFKNCPACNKKIVSCEMNDHLENCLNCTFKYEFESDKEDKNNISVPCPCCFKWFLESDMNNHIDECLTMIALKEEFIKS